MSRWNDKYFLSPETWPCGPLPAYFHRIRNRASRLWAPAPGRNSSLRLPGCISGNKAGTEPSFHQASDKTSPHSEIKNPNSLPSHFLEEINLRANKLRCRLSRKNSHPLRILYG